MEECHDWEEIEYIEATCPYCHVIDTYFGSQGEGDDARCKKCRKLFKLGERE